MDDEEIRLPSDTLKILEEFLKEKQEREAKEAETEGDGIDKFEENWQLSQFWYDDDTKQTLARLCERIIERQGWTLSTTRIALLSCPSAFAAVKAIGAAETLIFEYDLRFSKYGTSFVHYDYNEAFKDGVLDEYKGYFDIIIADPPFLAEECIEKMGRIMRKFAKESAKIVLCSGLVVQEWSKRHMDLELCKWEPKHHRNLGNQFASYANFPLDSLIADGGR